jgi:G2/mitotic-specific cyclin-B2
MLKLGMIAPSLKDITQGQTLSQQQSNEQESSNSSSSCSSSQQDHTNVGRNALGDIGNKLNKLNALATIVSVNNQAKKTVCVKVASHEANILLNKNNTTTSKIVIPIQSNNHTASMIEIESSSDEEEHVLESQEEENTSELPTDVDDIDADDIENTQLVAEYVKDIYYYLYYLEKRHRVSPNFLHEKIVTSKMRAVLIDWLLQVHTKFHLLHETLYLCVQIIDAYLEAVNVTKMQLQLVGVSAMFVACKYEEMYVPAIEDFVYMTDNTYTKSEIRQMEISILKTMNFMFSKPLPLHFLRRFSKAGRVRLHY